MDYDFRELTKEDIPSIAEIAQYMPDYFQNILTDAENLIDNPICYYYGMFQKNKLLGVGNLRFITSDYAWLESVRVAPHNQKKGIGTALFQHSIDKAKEGNYSIIAYATEGSNQGSCRIGKKLGFELITSMNSYWLKGNDIVIDTNKKIEHKPISVMKAFKLLGKISNGSIEEICIGWSYVPKEKSIFEVKNKKFYAIEKTVLLEIIREDEETNEKKYANAIIYGSETHIKELLNEFLIRNKSSKYIDCIINKQFSYIPKSLGFKPYTNDDGTPIEVLLWKMKLI